MPVASPSYYLYFLTNQLYIRGSHDPLLGFHQFSRATHRTQETHLLPRLPIYYKRIELRNSQMKEMHRARCGERARSFFALFGHHFPQIPPCSPTCKLSKPSPLGFLWRLHYIDMIDQIIGHWRLNSISSPPPPFPWGREGGTEHSNPRITGLAPLTTSPHP